MKGVRFYQDENGTGIKKQGWKKSFPNGFNGMAVFHENGFWSNYLIYCMEAVAAVQTGAGDGAYGSTSVSSKYIRENCRRVSEKEARKLFPNLFRTYFDEYSLPHNITK